MSFVAKSEEIQQKWQQAKAFDSWFENYGSALFERILQEIPADHELAKLLKRNIEETKLEHPIIANIRNEKFWLHQIAGMRALREEAKRYCRLVE